MKRVVVYGLLLGGASCLNVPSAPTQTVSSHASCNVGPSLPGSAVPQCLLQDGLIDEPTFRSADSLVRAAMALDTTDRDAGDTVNLHLAYEIERSVYRLSEYYQQHLFPDSVRFDRMIDQVAVTIEYARGTIPHIGARWYPKRTPYLTWHYYPGTGIFQHALETVQGLGAATPDTFTLPTDTLLKTAQALYHYAIWRDGGGQHFPMWEYQFLNNVGGINLYPPWRSSMPQGDVMRLFSELYIRTGDPIWASRAKEVLRSYEVTWNQGGVWLDDTSHGYWWEEAHPQVWVWNGSMQALIDLGVYAKRFPADTEAQRMWRRGLDAAQYYTPDYDTGTWLLYSRIQGPVAGHYARFYIALAKDLFKMTGDSTWNAYATKWSKYTPPPGLCVGGPCNDAPPLAPARPTTH